jgi:hypothetical protein
MCAVPSAEARDQLAPSGLRFELGVPVEVVEDVRRRRYEGPGTAPGEERIGRRAELTSEYLGPAMDALVRAYT